MTEIDIAKQCPICGHLSHLKVDKEKYIQWSSGELIQRVWPDSTPDWRELLKTGIHSKCWDELFKEDEGED